MEIPKEKRKALSINPKILLIYAAPKTGKTSICAGLEDHLFLELEKGADYVDARVLELNNPIKFNEALDSIKNSKEKVCKYLIVDTTTKMDKIKLKYN